MNVAQKQLIGDRLKSQGLNINNPFYQNIVLYTNGIMNDGKI
jgi:hypothetical protein